MDYLALFYKFIPSLGCRFIVFRQLYYTISSEELFALCNKNAVFMRLLVFRKRLIKIPHSGEITFTIGRVSLDNNLSKIGNSKNLDGDWFIDAVSGFEKSKEMEQFYSNRIMAAAVLWIIMTICVIIIMIVLQVRRRK